MQLPTTQEIPRKDMFPADEILIARGKHATLTQGAP
jgi:hypothetical protein